MPQQVYKSAIVYLMIPRVFESVAFGSLTQGPTQHAVMCTVLNTHTESYACFGGKWTYFEGPCFLFASAVTKLALWFFGPLCRQRFITHENAQWR